MSPSAESQKRRQRLIEIIKSLSVETGRTFKLASGRTSDFYCNLKPTMMDPEGSHLLGQQIAERDIAAFRAHGGLPRSSALQKLPALT